MKKQQHIWVFESQLIGAYVSQHALQLDCFCSFINCWKFTEDLVAWAVVAKEMFLLSFCLHQWSGFLLCLLITGTQCTGVNIPQSRLQPFGSLVSDLCRHLNISTKCLHIAFWFTSAAACCSAADSSALAPYVAAVLSWLTLVKKLSTSSFSYSLALVSVAWSL